MSWKPLFDLFPRPFRFARDSGKVCIRLVGRSKVAGRRHP